MGCSDQNIYHPTVYGTTRPRVLIFSLYIKADGYAFKCSLRLHTKEAIHRDEKKGRSGDASRGKPLDTYASYPSPLSGDTSPSTFYCERGRK